MKKKEPVRNKSKRPQQQTYNPMNILIVKSLCETVLFF